MDQKKKISPKWLTVSLAAMLIAGVVGTVSARRSSDDEDEPSQDLKVEFCGVSYRYAPSEDSITLYLKLLDGYDEKAEVNLNKLRHYLTLSEDGNEIISERTHIITQHGIPEGYTFTVLIDQGISTDGLLQVKEVVRQLVEEAPDSSVYLSFYGDEVSATEMASRDHFEDFNRAFRQQAEKKYFYSALYYKLAEVAGDRNVDYDGVPLARHYEPNTDVARRARANEDCNIMFVFCDGQQSPDLSDIKGFGDVTEYQEDGSHVAPRIYAFYVSDSNVDDDVEITLLGITQGLRIPEERRGQYQRSGNLDEILEKFNESVENQMYDFAFAYKATEGKDYTGKIEYEALWDGEHIEGKAAYSIGTPENPWPLRQVSAGRYLIALLATMLTFVFFFIVTKILIPLIKQKSFGMKYYKRYEAESVKRICSFCKQPIESGQMVVTRCAHLIHVSCWQQNDYHCPEYGQNCKTGIQDHVDWSNLFSRQSLRDSRLVISGILAGLLSWIIYELLPTDLFAAVSKGITNMFFTNPDTADTLSTLCTTKVSAFLCEGMLLAFFLSLIFRYNDEYRKKNAAIYLKIFGLSLLSSLIGMAAFAFGGIIFCMMLSTLGTTYVPWYCSLPAYVLFSVCASLSLTIKSSIPVKSAMLGGLCAAIIGFLVLYFTKDNSMSLLLDFIIYGGGLGASLVTVRMLAEKYFLVIQNGTKAGTRIPIHKWMNATGGGNKVNVGMAGDCEIQMNWDKSNRVGKHHAELYIDHTRNVPVIRPKEKGIVYNSRAELPTARPAVLANGDTFKVGDTIFKYEETD